MSNPSMPDIDIIKRAIRERHLEQLRDLDLVADPLEKLPIFATYDDLVQWTKDSTTQITTGINNRVYGGQIGSPINFNNAFMAFMESAAMYLRDTSKVVQAVEIYRSGRNTEEAFRLLEESTAQIDTLAAMWGMYFIQICDFVEIHPDGHRFLVGPFCGAFIPMNFAGNSPFVGVAFKGTSVTWEVINDLFAISTLRPSGRLWETEVSKGFYYPIFSTYNQTPTNLPFLMIQKAVQDIVTKATTTAITHVTGHSLGAAYSSLTYGQLCIEGYGTPKASLGDLYTFGSPRVGRGDFAEKVKASVSPPISDGSTWRIVNNKDYVPEVPASPPWPISRDPFIHVDSAYKIYPDEKPTAQPSEIGKNPTWSFPTTISPHYTTEYYKSLTYATTSKPPPHSPMPWGRYPLAISTFSNPTANIKTLKTDDVITPEISMEMNRDCVVGTIKYHCFFGEITAVGVIGRLNRNPVFHYNASDSWKSLYGKENQCIFTKKDDQTLEIGFIVEGAQVAWAHVSPESGDIGDVVLTSGSCVWTFCDAEKLTDVTHHIVEIAASIFN